MLHILSWEGLLTGNRVMLITMLMSKLLAAEVHNYVTTAEEGAAGGAPLLPHQAGGCPQAS